MKKRSGFTLIEVVIGMGVFLITILGMIAVYNQSIVLGRLSEGRVLALESAQAKLEEMRSHSYLTLTTDYNGVLFDPPGLDGKGITYVTPDANREDSWFASL